MIRTVAALVAVLTLSGCAGTSPAEPGTPAPAPATGVKISGTGYTYDVPAGWDVPPNPTPDFDPDSIAIDRTDVDDGFVDHVMVNPWPDGKVTPEDFETDVAKDMATEGFTDISVGDRISVAGTESGHLITTMTANGIESRGDQFLVSDDGKNFLVAFTFSMDVSEAERADVTSSVLASWTWTD